MKKLVGKDKHGKWLTSGSAAYPPKVCEMLATLISSVLRKGVVRSELQDALAEGIKLDCPGKRAGQSASDFAVDNAGGAVESTVDDGSELSGSGTDAVGPSTVTVAVGSSTGTVTVSKDSCVDSSVHNMDVERCVRWGPLVIAEWDSTSAELVDGFGLCSPSKWAPECCGYFMERGASELCASVRSSAEKYVLAAVPDVRELAFRLATGKVDASPFSLGVLEGFRSEWAALLQMPESALNVPEGQKFYLRLIAQTMAVIGDPDVDILVSADDSFASGVPVGYKERIKPTPGVFPPKVKQNRLDDSEYLEVTRNYRSAEDNAEGLLEKFHEDEAKGLMYPATKGALRATHRSWWRLWGRL